MECGQKAPPAAKFCPGCGNSMSLNNAKRVVEENEEPEDYKDKELKIPANLATISGEGTERVTIESVVASTPEGYQPQKIVRASNSQFKGLSTEELARKLAQINRSDGSREA